MTDERNTLIFVAVVAVSLFNGLLSPTMQAVALFWRVWMPELVPVTPETIFYGASMIVATSTLVFAGVPAALYERLAATAESDRVSMSIWFGAALLLSVPAMLALLARLAG
jgi:hypothetical protein